MILSVIASSLASSVVFAQDNQHPVVNDGTAKHGTPPAGVNRSTAHLMRERVNAPPSAGVASISTGSGSTLRYGAYRETRLTPDVVRGGVRKVDAQPLFAPGVMVSGTGTNAAARHQLIEVRLTDGKITRCLVLAGDGAAVQRKHRGGLASSTANGTRTLFIPWGTIQETAAGAHGFITAVDWDAWTVRDELNLTSGGCGADGTFVLDINELESDFYARETVVEKLVEVNYARLRPEARRADQPEAGRDRSARRSSPTR